MPSATLTVTAVAGPGDTLTAGVFSNVSELNLNFGSNTFSFRNNAGILQYFDWQSITTMTVTVSGHNATITLS